MNELTVLYFGCFIVGQLFVTATKPEFEKPIHVYCVSQHSQTEFDTYEINRNAKYSVKKVVGDQIELNIHFLAYYEGKTVAENGISFETAKALLTESKAAACIVSYGLIELGRDYSLPDRIEATSDWMSQFILRITSETNVTLDLISLSGYGEGGHVAGLVGRKVKPLAKGKEVSAIIAFDPLNSGYPEEATLRINKDCGKFVTIIHTSTLGVQESCGHVDVFVNDAVSQPGCQYTMDSAWCSHSAANVLRDLIIRKHEYVKRYATANRKNGESFTISVTTPDTRKVGEFHFKTGEIFGKEPTTLLQTILKTAKKIVF